MNFDQRRTTALAQLARMQAELQTLTDMLTRIKDVRSGDNWHGWSRFIETAHDDLGKAVADVSRNAVLA